MAASVLALFLSPQLVWAEKGCDPAIPEAHGDVTFVCHGFTEEQLRLLPKISLVLDGLVANDVGLDAKLDNLLAQLQPDLASKNKKPMEIPAPAKPAPVVKPEVEQEVISYDYRGFKKSSLVGLMMGEPGESEEYQKLLTLQKTKQWKKLLKESSREIKYVPAWLTPYAFKGVALVHLDKPKEAIAVLAYVDSHTVGDPDYDQVRHLLSELQAKAAK